MNRPNRPQQPAAAAAVVAVNYQHRHIYYQPLIKSKLQPQPQPQPQEQQQQQHLYRKSIHWVCIHNTIHHTVSRRKMASAFVLSFFSSSQTHHWHQMFAHTHTLTQVFRQRSKRGYHHMQLNRVHCTVTLTAAAAVALQHRHQQYQQLHHHRMVRARLSISQTKVA